MLKNLMNAVKNWWLLLIVGIISLICGIILVCSPAVGFSTLSILLTVELIAAGIAGIAFVLSNKDRIPSWGWYLVLPILLVICGITTAGTFGGSQVLLISFFATGVLFKGIETIAYAISLSKVKGSGWGWTLVGGILVVIFSGFLYAHPLFDALVLGYMAAFSMIFIGIDAIVVSIQLSKIKSAAKKVQDIVE